jgi:hypothetical protein
MRAIVCVVTFVILLLAGFLATPGVFKMVNPEYLLALREVSGPLAKLTLDASDTNSKIADLESRISGLQKSITDASIAATAKQASMHIANAPAADIAAVAVESASKIAGLKSEVDQASAEKAVLKDKRDGIEANRAELRKKLDASAADSVNIYLVARALALGAIGALMSIFAKYLSIPSTQGLFEDKASMGRMWASIAMGGIVAVVVIGLFFTGFISIFANGVQNTNETDFWKVTILCLLAGAFSDRLFQAAANKMEAYLHTDDVEGKAKTLVSHTKENRAGAGGGI